MNKTNRVRNAVKKIIITRSILLYTDEGKKKFQKRIRIKTKKTVRGKKLLPEESKTIHLEKKQE